MTRLVSLGVTVGAEKISGEPRRSDRTLWAGLAPAAGAALPDPIPGPIRWLPIGLATVATGLTAPNWATFAPGVPDRLFVTDQNGILWAVDLNTGAKTAFLDVSGRVVPTGERGLLGVAFHPAYQSNGLVYTYTSEPTAVPTDFPLPPASPQTTRA